MIDRTTGYDPGIEHINWVVPTPLSDPIFTAIFQSVEVSGLAMRSLINATLEDSGDRLIGEVVSVTPQSVHSETSPRGFRIDVEAKSSSGEVALVEVQIKKIPATIERALIYAEQSLTSVAKRGDTLEEVIFAMPRVIVINIIGISAALRWQLSPNCRTAL